MRTFFVFDIRDEYLALYYNYEISLYNLLKQVYNIKKDNIITLINWQFIYHVILSVWMAA